MKNRILLLCCFFILHAGYRAQDYHLSNYDLAALYYNPATTGMFGNDRGDYRFAGAQRSQWRSMGIKPFLTSYLSFDQPYEIRNRSVGIGCFLINNNGGIGNFNTLTFMGSASYDILNSKTKLVSTGVNGKKHLLTVGLQMGLFYRSTNPGALNYDVQYSIANQGGAFDENLPSNEVDSRLNMVRFEANYGIFYKNLQRGKKIHPFAGFSMAHLTRPNESFTGADSRVPIRFTGYGGLDIKINERIDLTPRMLYMNQAKAQEVTPGILVHYRVNDNDLKVMASFDFRMNDALVFALGMKSDKYTIRFGYDINNSYLKNYSNGRGAFEISLLYMGRKSKSLVQKGTRY